MIAFWMLMLLLSLIGVACIGIGESAEDVKRRELIARAEQEHAQLMRGDARGLYVRFPPADL
jgi:hypothetical protein